jgi:hypothetical protein
MQKSVKAALLSGFVFPGVGHFFLKRHMAGAALVCTAVASLYLVVSYAVQRALTIAEKIQRGEVRADIESITEMVSRHPAGAEAEHYNIALLVFAVTWLFGIVDSYRVGRSQDNENVKDR